MLRHCRRTSLAFSPSSPRKPTPPALYSRLDLDAPSTTDLDSAATPPPLLLPPLIRSSLPLLLRPPRCGQAAQKGRGQLWQHPLLPHLQPRHFRSSSSTHMVNTGVPLLPRHPIECLNLLLPYGPYDSMAQRGRQWTHGRGGTCGFKLTVEVVRSTARSTTSAPLVSTISVAARHFFWPQFCSPLLVPLPRVTPKSQRCLSWLCLQCASGGDGHRL